MRGPSYTISHTAAAFAIEACRVYAVGNTMRGVKQGDDKRGEALPSELHHPNMIQGF